MCVKPYNSSVNFTRMFLCISIKITGIRHPKKYVMCALSNSMSKVSRRYILQSEFKIQISKNPKPTYHFKD